MPTKLNIFISYSSRDRDLRQIFVKHLEKHLYHPDCELEIWTDVEISTGGDWNTEIQHALTTSQIGILLVSPAFFSSSYIKEDELKKMLEARQEAGYLVFPVLLRACRFWTDDNLKAVQFFKTYQSEYDVSDLTEVDDFMPFDKLIDIHNPSGRLLNLYFEKLTEKLYQSINKLKLTPTPKFTPANVTQPTTFDLPDPQSWDVSHALRPTFTRTLSKDLLIKRRRMNLTGDEGLGKSRCLADVETLCKQLHVPVVRLNLKEYRLNYALFLTVIAQQVGLQEQAYDTFDALILALQDHLSQALVFMLDNLDVLNDYASNDSRYDHHFVSQLNLLKNDDRVLLLCASRTWLKAVRFNDETSLLELLQRPLPDTLSEIDIDNELRREVDDYPRLNDTQQREIRQAIQQHPQPVACLNFIADKLNYSDDVATATEQLPQWLNEYDG